MKYQCAKCHYISDKQEAPSRCPYCGEKGVMEKASVAQDILNEL